MLKSNAVRRWKLPSGLTILLDVWIIIWFRKCTYEPDDGYFGGVEGSVYGFVMQIEQQSL